MLFPVGVSRTPNLPVSPCEAADYSRSLWPLSYNGIFIIVLTMYKNMTEGGGRGYPAGASADDSTIIKVSRAKTVAGAQKKTAAPAVKQRP